MSITSTYILVCLLWSAYFALHSLLATNKVKNAFNNMFPSIQAYYRILFNLIAIGTLLPLAWYTLSIDDIKLLDNLALKIAGFVVLVVGLVVSYFAFRSFNVKEFLGLTDTSKLSGSSELIRTGMYKIVRHPLYFAVIMIFLGLLLLMPTIKILLVDVVVFAYLVIGSKLEEVKLIEEFGDAYKVYQKEVKALIPFIY